MSVLLILLVSAMLAAACGGPGPAPLGQQVTVTPSARPAEGVSSPGPAAAQTRPFALPTASDLPALPPADGAATSQRDAATPGEPGATATPVPMAVSAAAATETPAPTRTALIQHVVQPGETLFGLAVDYGVSMAGIQLASGLDGGTELVAGQTLAIPNGAQWLEEQVFWIVHVVRPGETLVGLADTYGLTVDEILRVNAISDPALIHLDQQLVMPLTQLVTLKAERATATPAAIAAAPASPAKEPTPSATESSPSTTAEADSEPPQPQVSPTVVPAPPGPPAGEADWPNYILARINRARAEHGLNPLTLVPALTRAAQAHAEDCARRGWGSHVGSDGAVLQTRLERAGYVGRNWGENWVQARDAERAFEWWYGEIPPNDPHRRNILSPRYTEVGIGIAQSDWGYIFITDFGRR